MPFVDKNHRQYPNPAVPGDRCYVEYKKLMDMWRDSSRWTTVDEMVEELFGWEETERAKFLAFMVFFNLRVMPHELEKREENGDV